MQQMVREPGFIFKRHLQDPPEWNGRKYLTRDDTRRESIERSESFTSEGPWTHVGERL